MKKAGLILSSVLFSLFIILSSSAFADKGSHSDSSGNGPADHQKFEEGSGSSAVGSSMEKAEEYKSDHEGKEEGSFSYKRHRKEMKAKEKAMQEEIGASGKMEEGSGKK